MLPIIGKRGLSLGAILIFLIAAVVKLRDVLEVCSVRSVGLFGDAYSAMWTNWVMSRQGFPPWKQRTQYSGFPEGELFWSFDWWTSSLVRLTMYGFTLVFGPVCSYNIMVLLGLAFSSFCAWLLTHKITNNFFVSVLAGFAFGFGSFTQVKMTGHINYMFVGVYALLIYFLIDFSKRSNFQMLGIALLFGSFSYLDGYFFIPTLVVVLALFIYKTLRSIRNRSFLETRSFFIFFTTYLLSQLPLFLLFVFADKADSAGLPQRDWNELYVYSIKFWYFFVPAGSNEYFGKYLSGWAERRLNGTNFSETSLFPGFFFILFAIYFLIRQLNGLRKIRLKTKSSLLINRHQRIFILILCMFVLGIALSFKPIISVLGIPIPLPSGILFEIAPYWRTISRWLIFSLCIIVLGAMGFNEVGQRISQKKYRFLACLAVALVSLDLGVPKSFSPRFENAIKQSGPYSWISNNTEENSIILDLVPYSVDGFFLGQALTSKRKMVNTFRQPEKSLQKQIFYPERPDFICSLTQARVDYFIYHPDLHPVRLETSPFYRKVFEYSPMPNDPQGIWNKAEIYKVGKRIFPTYDSQYDANFHLEYEDADYPKWFLKNDVGSVNLVRESGSVTHKSTSFLLQLESRAYTENVSVFADGVLIWNGLLKGKKDIPLLLNSKKRISLSFRRSGNTNLDPITSNFSVEFKQNCRL